MLKLFRHLFTVNLTAVSILFFVLILATTGFLLMKELTRNVENAVSLQTRPYIGADMTISSSKYSDKPLIETFRPYLSGYVYEWGEKTEFSTTLFDEEGNTGLVKVIAYTGKYPLYGILKTEALTGSQVGRVFVTPGILDRYASERTVSIDTRNISIDARIIETSESRFNFSDDGNLIILPRESLSGSMLLSSGSRLDQDLLLGFPKGGDLNKLKNSLRSIEELRDYRIRTYTDSARETSESTEELSRYLLLITIVAALFAGIILRSAHSTLLEKLAATLRILETLGFSRSRQMALFGLLYLIILPTSFLTSIGIAYGLFVLIAQTPETEGFVFGSDGIIFTLQVMSVLVFSSFLPGWSRFFRYEKLSLKTILFWERYIPPSLLSFFTRKNTDKGNLWTYISFALGVYLLLFIVFQDIVFSLLILGSGIIILFITAIFLTFLFAKIWVVSERWRVSYFYMYDGIRTLIRPLTPTIPLATSLIFLSSFLFLFLLFSFSFRERVTLDTKNSPNVYAINILEKDRPNIEKFFPDDALYSVLRARVKSINNKSLEEHLGAERVGREFTREFNITTNPLDHIPIVRGKDTIGTGEVSVDEEFAGEVQLELGDKVEFLLAGRSVVFNVANIRKSTRSGFSPFFYFSFKNEGFETAPRTYFLTAYTSDLVAWKRQVIKATGSHVTFVDIENILRMVKDIGLRILSVISLFLLSVVLFAVLAIYTLFGSLRPIESIKLRLYSLFGATMPEINTAFRMSRTVIFFVSFIVSIVLGLSFFLFMTRSNTFLTLTFGMISSSLAVLLLLYVVLFVLVRRRKT